VQFGVSTQLYHARRLRRDHLAEVAAHGFGAVEIIATRSHLDYHDAAALDEAAGWLTQEGLRLHSLHAPVMERFDGRWINPLSIASPDDEARVTAVRETAAALELARRVPVSVLVVHPGLQDSLLTPTIRNSREALLRSIEEIVALASPLGVRVALEVIPNEFATAEALAATLEELDIRSWASAWTSATRTSRAAWWTPSRSCRAPWWRRTCTTTAVIATRTWLPSTGRLTGPAP